MKTEITKADVLAGGKDVEIEYLYGEKETVRLAKIPWRKVVSLEVRGTEFVEKILEQSLPEEKRGDAWLETLTVESLGRLQGVALALSVSGTGPQKKLEEALKTAQTTASSPAIAPSAS